MKCHSTLALTCFSIHTCVTQMRHRQHRYQPRLDPNLADDALPALINPSFKSDIPQNQEESPCTCCCCASQQIGITVTSQQSWARLMNNISAFLGAWGYLILYVAIPQMLTAHVLWFHHVTVHEALFLCLSYPVLIEMISMRGFFLILGRSSLAPPSLRPPSFFCPNRRTEWPESRRRNNFINMIFHNIWQLRVKMSVHLKVSAWGKYTANICCCGLT